MSGSFQSTGASPLSANTVELFYDEFNNLNAWTGDINGTNAWFANTTYGFNASNSAYKDSYGFHTITHQQSTLNYTNVTVSFWEKSTQHDSGEYLRVEWFDGLNWTALGSWYGQNNWTSQQYVLPSSASNKSNFAVRLVCYDWHNIRSDWNYDYCAIDTLRIKADPLPAPPQTCSDGTQWYQCSVTQPLYCQNGSLVNHCNTCGCTIGLSCNVTSGACYTYVPSLREVFYDEFTTLNAWSGDKGTPSINWIVKNNSGKNGTTCADAYDTDGVRRISHNQSTAGYTNISLSFWYNNTGLDKREYLAAWYKTSTNWVLLENLTGNTAAWTYKAYSMPSSANNNTAFGVQFECNNNLANEHCAVDTLRIRGYQ